MSRKMTKKQRLLLKRKRRRRRFRIVFIMILIVAIAFTGKSWFSNKILFNRSALEKEGCPESLIRLGERNPETRAFVKGYGEYTGTIDDIDISGEVHQGKIPHFLQWDKRWGYEKYGDNYLAITGCGPTCLSMVYSGITGHTDLDPYRMARKAEKEGYYVNGSGSSWSMMDQMAKEIGLQLIQVSFEKNQMIDVLKEGNPIICIMGPGDFTKTGHFIVLTGVDRRGKVIVNDPNSQKNSEKSWDIDTIMKQTKSLWGYQNN